MCSWRTRFGVVILACAATLLVCSPTADAGKRPRNSWQSLLGVVSTPVPIKLGEYGKGYLYGSPGKYYFISYGCVFYPMDRSDILEAYAYLHPKRVARPYQAPSSSASVPATSSTTSITPAPTPTTPPAQAAPPMIGCAGACFPSGPASLPTVGRYRPYDGYGSPGSSPYQSAADPFGGYLSGGADVINSQGSFMVSQQEASLIAEYGRQARLETRRRQFDEWLYERAHRPTLEDEREISQQRELRRSRDDAPVTEIWSGKSLNSLLVDLQKLDGKDSALPEIELEADLLEQINVTTGTSGGHVGLLRDGGRLIWPIALRITVVQEDRQQLEGLAIEAVRQVTGGRLDAATLRELARSVTKLQKRLAKSAEQLPPGQYIEAKRFLNDLDGALTVLHQPDARQYFDGNYVAKGETVAELVRHMAKHGLRFAPAVLGDEDAYVTLHGALAACDVRAQLAADR